MARPLRIDVPDAWHHVMNRGAGHQSVFRTVGDGQRFERLLTQLTCETTVQVHAACLMSNHYHLLLRCPDGGLALFMQQLGSVYTRQFNQRHGRDGRLFRSRYLSLLVDSGTYLERVWRYIHRNPLDIRPPVRLDRYRWSSYRYFAIAAAPPPWLTVETFLGYYESRAHLRRLVEDDHIGGSLSAAEVDWAVRLSLDEVLPDERVAGAGMIRTVAYSLLSHSNPEVRAALETFLAFKTKSAQKSAEYRARQRQQVDPAVTAAGTHFQRLVANGV